MSVSLSGLVDKIKPSFTLQMTARAAALRAKGVDVINFGVGEPDLILLSISSKRAKKQSKMATLNTLQVLEC